MTNMEWYHLYCDAMCARSTGDIADAIMNAMAAVAAGNQAGIAEKKLCGMHNYLADLYVQHGKYCEAEAAIRCALALSDGQHWIIHGDNLFILAKVQFMTGFIEEARNTAEHARKSYRECEHSHGVAMMDDFEENFFRQRTP